MSVRLRLTLWYAGLMTLTLVTLSVLLYFVLHEAMTIETDTFLESKANDLAVSIHILSELPPPPLAGHLLPDPDRFAEGDVYAQLLTPSGMIIDQSSSLGDVHQPMDPSALARAQRGETSFQTVLIQGVRVRVYTLPVAGRNGRRLVLQVGRSFERIERTMNWLQRELFVGDLALIILASAVGWWMAGSSLRPVVKVTRTAQEIGESQRLDQRVEYNGPSDEIGELVHTFNRMLDRLQAGIEAQRRFVADASHELRTPLTTLRLNVELLRRDRSAETPERAEVLDDIAAELERLSRLVHGLLDLARADSGVRLDKQPVRADEVMRDVYHQVKPTTDGVVLKVGDLVPTTCIANPDYLKQLLLTLVDNAVKYSEPGGQVTLDLERDDQWIKFRVSDNGLGIAPEDLPHIFERFYRSRTVRRKRGTGLGLAVAQWIAQAHGGHIEVQSEPGHGSTFTVWLPENSSPRAS